MILAQEKAILKSVVQKPAANMNIREHPIQVERPHFKPEPPPHITLKPSVSSSNAPPNCNIIVIDQMPCIQPQNPIEFVRDSTPRNVSIVSRASTFSDDSKVGFVEILDLSHLILALTQPNFLAATF